MSPFEKAHANPDRPDVQTTDRRATAFLPICYEHARRRRRRHTCSAGHHRPIGDRLRAEQLPRFPQSWGNADARHEQKTTWR